MTEQAQELSRAMARLVRMAYKRGHGDLHKMSLEEIQAYIREIAPQTPAHYESYDITPSQDYPHLKYRLYPCPTTSTGTLYYIRSSAFTGGGMMDDTDEYCTLLAQKCQMDVLNLGFRLAPKHKFPTFFDDLRTLIEAIQADDSVALHPRSIVWGESSGGTMAAGLCHHMPHRFEAQVLVYGMFDLVTPYPSKSRYGYGYMMDLTMIEWLKQQVVSDVWQVSDYRLSPGLAKSIPPQPKTIILSAECDPLKDETFAYEQRLKAMGTEVVHRCQSGVVHGFMRYVQKLKEAQDSLDWIITQLAPSPAKLEGLGSLESPPSDATLEHDGF